MIGIVYVVKRVVAENDDNSGERRITTGPAKKRGITYLGVSPETGGVVFTGWPATHETWIEDPIKASKFSFNSAAAKVYEQRAVAENDEREANVTYGIAKVTYAVEDIELPEVE